MCFRSNNNVFALFLKGYLNDTKQPQFFHTKFATHASGDFIYLPKFCENLHRIITQNESPQDFSFSTGQLRANLCNNDGLRAATVAREEWPKVTLHNATAV